MANERKQEIQLLNGSTVSLTERQKAFCIAYATGPAVGNATQSAIAAGYAPQTAHKKSFELLQRAQVHQMLRDLHVQNITACRTIATKVALECLLDKEFPPGPKVQLIKTVLTEANTKESQDNQALTQDKPLTERSRAELEAFVKAGVTKVAELRSRGIPEENQRLIEGRALSMDDSAPSDREND